MKKIILILLMCLHIMFFTSFDFKNVNASSEPVTNDFLTLKSELLAEGINVDQLILLPEDILNLELYESDGTTPKTDLALRQDLVSIGSTRFLASNTQQSIVMIPTFGALSCNLGPEYCFDDQTGGGGESCPDGYQYLYQECVPDSEVCESNSSYFTGFTPEEIIVSLKYPHHAYNVKIAADLAYQYTTEKYGANGNGDISDAYRHGLWASLIQSKINNQSISLLFLSAHEGNFFEECISDLHTQMDFFNNSVGVQIAIDHSTTDYVLGIPLTSYPSNTEFKEIVYQAIDDGEFKYIRYSELVWTDE